MTGLNRKFIVGIRVAASLSVILALAILFAKNLAIGGEMTVTSDLRRPAPFVSEPKPGDRLEQTGGEAGNDLLSSVKGSPVYLDINPPVGFESVTQVVRYRNESGAMLELGALASTLDGQFDVRPGESPLIDGLSWRRISSGSLVLLERNHRYASLDDFYANPPNRSDLAVWGTTASGIPYRHPDYRPLPGGWEATVSLRGQHRFLTYIKDETLSVSFSVQDMNRTDGADPVIITVFAEGDSRPLARTVLDDDGNILGNQRSSGLRTVSVSAGGLPEGAYQVEFTAPGDVFIRRFQTAQRLFVIANRIFLGDFVGYSDGLTPIRFWSDGQRYRSQIRTDGARQIMDLNGVPFGLSEPFVPVIRRLPGGSSLSTLVSPKRDVTVETDGVFALTEQSYFNPLPYRIGWHSVAEDLDSRGIDFILTDYRTPSEEGGLKVAKAEFRADGLARTPSGAWRFLVSVPGTSESQGSVDLDSVSFILHRKQLSWSDIGESLKRMFSGDSTGGEPVVSFDGESFGEFPE